MRIYRGRVWSLVFMLVGLLAGCVQQPTLDYDSDMQRVANILRDLDDLSRTPEQQLKHYLADAVILAPDQNEIRGHPALLDHFRTFASNTGLTIRHSIVELDSFAGVIVLQGKVTGQFQPHTDAETIVFETKNILLFKRDHGGRIKIWKIIYNQAPAP